MNDNPAPDRPILKDVVPVLATRNLDAALSFYCELLGFQLGWKWGDPPDIASVCYDQVEFNLAVRQEESLQTSTVYIVVEKIDLLYQTWMSAGLEVTTPIADQEYGMRDFEFEDLDGNRICVGEAIDV